MRNYLIFGVLSATVVAGATHLAVQSGSSAAADKPMPLPENRAAPEFEGVADWVNSKPLTIKEQKGKVVALHFWTFGCANCIHNYGWYNGWHKDFAAKGLTVIGVHTPEFSHEAKVDQVRDKVKRNNIEYPIAVDNGSKVWKAWDNHYWPTVYLIDKKGTVRFKWEGELGADSKAGDKVLRGKIQELLDEK